MMIDRSIALPAAVLVGQVKITLVAEKNRKGGCLRSVVFLPSIQPTTLCLFMEWSYWAQAGV